MTTAVLAAAAAAKARTTDCPRCASDPLEPCWPDMHLERVIRAWRYGWVTDAELTALLEELHAFTLGMAFRQVAESGVAA